MFARKKGKVFGGVAVRIVVDAQTPGLRIMAKDNDVAKGFAMFSVYLTICHFPFCYCNVRTKILWREAKPICSCLLLLLLLLQDFRKRLIFSGSGFAKLSACELFALLQSTVCLL